MRRAGVVCVAFWLVSALFVGIGGLWAAPSDDHEGGFVGRIGDERAAAGLGGYVVAPDLVDVARRHAEEMRRQQRLHHNPSLGSDVAGWQAVGENVGVGPSVEEIHRKLMASPSHRDNILSGRFTEVGVGVVVDGADLWVVQVFRLPQSSSAAPAAEPAGEPAPSEPTGPQPPPEGGTSPSPSPSSGPQPGPAATAAPEARAANSPAGGGGGGSVRAASSAAGPTASTTSPSTTTIEAATPSTALAATGEVPTSVVPATTATAGASAPAADAVGATASTAGAPAPSSGVGDIVGTSGERQVTWPVAMAATMLLGVVIALLTHVGGARVRELAGRRSSLLDVWELALAR